MNRLDDRGRPLSSFLATALAMIQSSEQPISTSQLIDHFKLKGSDAMVLRGGLRRAQEQGEIREVAVHQDKSLTWLAGRLSIARCAGHAANLFLDRESPGARIDPEKFEDWLINEKQLQN